MQDRPDTARRVGVKPGPRPADPTGVNSAALAPTADDPSTLGLHRLCGGLAAVHLALLAGTLAEAGTPSRWFLLGLEVAAALLFAVLAFLAGTRRLPGWRRETVAAVLPVIAVIAATTRIGLTGSPWPAAELLLAVTAAVLVTTRVLFASVLGVCASGLVVGSVLDAVREPDVSLALVAGWVQLGLLMLAGSALALAVRRARVASAVALVEAHRTLLEQSVRDPLTGLANRKGLAMFARPMIDLARRQGQAVHCLVVDVDTLRDVNEDHGVRDGDEVLVAVAAGLQAAVRTTDVVARWGGDEFVLLGPGTGVSPLEMERRIRVHLSQTENLPRGSWQGKVSAGSATLVPWDGDDMDGLLHRAEQDLALRRSLKRRAAARMRADEAEPVPPSAGATATDAAAHDAPAPDAAAPDAAAPDASGQ